MEYCERMPMKTETTEHEIAPKSEDIEEDEFIAHMSKLGRTN